MIEKHNNIEYRLFFAAYMVHFPKGSDMEDCQIQWRIQDFPQGGAPTSKIAIIFQIFAENCMKMKEFGPPGGGGGASLAPPLDPPMRLVQAL